MKLIIDVPEQGVSACKLWVEMGVASWQDKVIANGIPLQDGEFLLTLMQSVMTPEQLKEVLQKMVDERVGNSEQVKGDLISREALKKAMEQADKEAIDYEMLAGMYEHLVRNAPTVEPIGQIITAYTTGFDTGVETVKRPQAEWVNHRNDYGHNIADCSLCGKAMQWHDEDEDGIPRYCWYCGAKMRKKEKEE